MGLLLPFKYYKAVWEGADELVSVLALLVATTLLFHCY